MISNGPAATAAQLHIIYRSHGGENLKNRPAYYSKLLALTSLIRAVRLLDAPAEVLFFNDGPIPDDRVRLMRAHGKVLRGDYGSNRASYRAALDLAAHQPWPDDDLVWFAEDDYLYAPDSLRTLRGGIDALPGGDYFSLYSPVDVAAGGSRPASDLPPWPPSAAGPGQTTVDGTRWFRADSTTSTYGVRMAALRQDRRLLRLCPYSGGAWDHTSCLTVQGQRPFRRGEIGADLIPFRATPPSMWPRSILRGLSRVGVSLRSRRRPSRRRSFYAADPLPIHHLETVDAACPQGEVEALNAQNWAQLAAQTLDWAAANGIRLAIPQPQRQP